jgi:hypothetical protein
MRTLNRWIIAAAGVFMQVALGAGSHRYERKFSEGENRESYPVLVIE